MKDYLSRLFYRLTHPRGFEYVIIALIVYNLALTIKSLILGDFSGALINGLFLFLCLASLR